MLYDASGQAICLFDAQPGTGPECDGECADDRPPVVTSGKPRARGSVRADLLGTARRSDGAAQVTYAGHPLYFYAHEGKYEVLCHNIEERPPGSSLLDTERLRLLPAKHNRGGIARRRSDPLRMWVAKSWAPVSRLNARLKASSES